LTSLKTRDRLFPTANELKWSTAMELFHHITVFFLDEEEKNGLVKAGVVFKTVAKGSRGENATFEIAENAANWPRVDALLSSMGDRRVRDFSTTVPYGVYLQKITRAHLDEYLKTKGQPTKEEWELGREFMLKSFQLAKAGDVVEALQLLDGAIAQGICEDRTEWVRRLCRQAAAFSLYIGDPGREISYSEQALRYAKDYRFAVYNFAKLLLKHGHVLRAEQCATEAYRLTSSDSCANEEDRDLVAAIARDWPGIAT
jgi:hypothetical protein